MSLAATSRRGRRAPKPSTVLATIAVVAVSAVVLLPIAIIVLTAFKPVAVG